jgi:hypothetical protein
MNTIAFASSPVSPTITCIVIFSLRSIWEQLCTSRRRRSSGSRLA